ncbi:hypothetical protein MNBD_PLANCTO03-1181 [hydrothermal vent metagenome]|uniref:Acyloxyacyl hydrolase n=1 Tax=hydrothermal vent metagenome TaxID=652676 RepID=A0A3B1DZ60_9ZZZZ
MMTRRVLSCAFVLLVAPVGPALAATDPAAPPLSTEGARLSLSTPEANKTALPDGPAPAARYGAEGTEWILFGTGFAHDFDASTDLNINIGYSIFFVDNIEWVLELGAWYHSQPGDNALSINPVMDFRWHFYNTGKTSFFANAGIGLLGATDNVPDKGTGFNFTPRIGVGLTHQISDDGTRLIAGLRWHHISNARLNGESRNPDRDAPMLYMQIAVPF